MALSVILNKPPLIAISVLLVIITAAIKLRSVSLGRRALSSALLTPPQRSHIVSPAPSRRDSQPWSTWKPTVFSRSRKASSMALSARVSSTSTGPSRLCRARPLFCSDPTRCHHPMTRMYRPRTGRSTPRCSMLGGRRKRRAKTSRGATSTCRQRIACRYHSHHSASRRVTKRATTTRASSQSLATPPCGARRYRGACTTCALPSTPHCLSAYTRLTIVHHTQVIAHGSPHPGPH